MTPETCKRWALLCVKAIADGKHDVAADIVATFMLGHKVTASEIKRYDTPNGDVPVLEELHDMLDELGYDSIMKMGEKRRAELEGLPRNSASPIPIVPMAR